MFKARRIASELTLREIQSIDELFQSYSDVQWAQNYIINHKYRCADDLKIIKANSSISKPTILNIGGAPYIFEALCNANDLSCVSFDLDPDRFKSVIKRNNVNVKKVNIESPGFFNGSSKEKYDVVLLAEVFEHLRIDIIQTLDRLKDFLSTESKLLITTPNFFYFRRFISFLINDRSGPSLVEEWGKLSNLGHMGHVREYSKKELIEFFESTGFKVEKVYYRNRTSSVVKSRKSLIPSFISYILEHYNKRFVEEFVFVLVKSEMKVR